MGRRYSRLGGSATGSVRLIGGWPLWLRLDDATPRLQPVLAFDHDTLAGAQPLVHQRRAILRLGDFDHPHCDGVVWCYDKYVGSFRPALHSGFRDDDATLPRREMQPSIDKLARPKRVSLIREICLELESPRLPIDRVIDRRERTDGKDGLPVATEGGDGGRIAGSKSVVDLREVVFWKRANDGDRLKLHNDDDAGGIGGADHVALVDDA